jgi:hypothetical protein
VETFQHDHLESALPVFGPFLLLPQPSPLVACGDDWRFCRISSPKSWVCQANK